MQLFTCNLLLGNRRRDFNSINAIKVWKCCTFCYSSILPRNALKLGLESIKVFNNVFPLLPRARLAPDWRKEVIISSLIGWDARHLRALPELRLSARNPALVIAHAWLLRSAVISRYLGWPIHIIRAYLRELFIYK